MVAIQDITKYLNENPKSINNFNNNIHYWKEYLYFCLLSFV